MKAKMKAWAIHGPGGFHPDLSNSRSDAVGLFVEKTYGLTSHNFALKTLSQLEKELWQRARGAKHRAVKVLVKEL